MNAPIVEYVAAAGQTDFDVPFPFLSPTHVEVRANGIRYYPSEWVSAARLRLFTAPGAGAFVTLTRNTPVDAQLVQFQNGAVLTQEDLNTAVQQVLFKQQELMALYEGTLLKARVRIGEAGGIAVTPDDAANQLASMIAADQVLAEFRQRVADLDVSAETIISQALHGVDRHSRNAAAIRVETEARLTDKAAFAQRSTEIEASISGAVALIRQVETASAAADAALATSLETLGVALGNDIAAAIVSERSARVTALAAEASSREALAVRIGSAESVIQQNAQARADQDGVFAGMFALMGVKSPDGSAFVLSDSSLRMSNGTTLAERLAGIEASTGGNVATVAEQVRVLTDRVGAQAEAVTVVNSAVGGLSSSVSTISQSVNGIAGRYGVQLDNNGYITGYVMNNDGRSGDMTIGVDVFRIINRVNGNAIYPFLVRDGKVFINEAYISELHADKIVAGTIVADKLVWGTLTPGQFANGAVGEASAYYDANPISFNTQDWTNVISIGLTPAQGLPIFGQFNVCHQNVSGDLTDVMTRIIRDDGTVVWGDVGGTLLGVRDEGATASLTFFDNVQRHRSTTYHLQMRKRSNRDVVSITFRIGWLQELSRLHFQSFTVNSAGGNAGSSGGPGSGDGGGGYNPDIQQQ